MQDEEDIYIYDDATLLSKQPPAQPEPYEDPSNLLPGEVVPLDTMGVMQEELYSNTALIVDVEVPYS
jgi:hypothetical protein